MTATEASLSHITETLQRARELLVQGGNDSNGQVAREGIAAEIEALTEAVKQEANATFDGRFIFSGTETETRPYELGANDEYAGNEGSIKRVIGTGSNCRSTSTSRNCSAKARGAGDDKLLDVMRDIATDLRGGTEENAENLRGTDLSRLSDNLDELTRVRAVVGATTNRLDDRGHAARTTAKKRAWRSCPRCATPTCRRRSSNSPREQTAYETALRSAAKIIQPSLMDFLS